MRGAVVTFVDITERKRAHDEIERRVAERTRELRELADHLETVRETDSAPGRGTVVRLVMPLAGAP